MKTYEISVIRCDEHKNSSVFCRRVEWPAGLALPYADIENVLRILFSDKKFSYMIQFNLIACDNK